MCFQFLFSTDRYEKRKGKCGVFYKTAVSCNNYCNHIGALSNSIVWPDIVQVYTRFQVTLF